MHIKYELVSLKPITGLHNQSRNLEAVHVLNVLCPVSNVWNTFIVCKRGIKRNGCLRRSQEQRYLLQCTAKTMAELFYTCSPRNWPSEVKKKMKITYIAQTTSVQSSLKHDAHFLWRVSWDSTVLLQFNCSSIITYLAVVHFVDSKNRDCLNIKNRRYLVFLALK